MEHSPTTSGGAEGEEKPAPPPLYTCKEDSIAAALLRQHESFTAISACPALYCLGTSTGKVHLLSLDSCFIVSHDFGSRKDVPIKQLGFSAQTDLVVVLLDGGQVQCWNWRTGVTSILSSGKHGKTMAFQLSDQFTGHSGHVFLSRTDGQLVKRTFGGLLHHTDTSIYACNPSLLQRLFGGQSKAELSATGSILQNLCYNGSVLLFTCGRKLFCVSEAKSQVVATFKRSDGQISVQGSASTHDLSEDDLSAAPIVLVLSGQYFIAQYPDAVFLFYESGFEDSPFNVACQLSCGGQQLAASLGSHILLVLPDAASTAQVRLVSSDDQCVQKLAVQTDSTQLQLATTVASGLGSRVDSTHAFLVAPKRIHIFRVLLCSEQLLWLLRTKRFPLAMHLCTQKYQRSQVLIEVANTYACDIWKKGKLVEAMRIWGEVVLPLAPAAYWDEFVRRLSVSGHIDLVVTWLPFNDRSKVAPIVYQDLLTEPLQKRMYLKLLSRVSRWPVRYPLQPVLDAIFKEISSFSEDLKVISSKKHVTNSDLRLRLSECMVLLITLYKLFEFENAFIEAAQESHVASSSFLMLPQALRYILQLNNLGITVSTEGFVGDNASYVHALEKSLSSIWSLELWSYCQLHDLWSVFCLPDSVPTNSSTDADIQALTVLEEIKETPAVARQETNIETNIEHMADSSMSPIKRAGSQRLDQEQSDDSEDEDAFHTPSASPIPADPVVENKPSLRRRRLFSLATRASLIVQRTEFLSDRTRQRQLLRSTLEGNAEQVFHCVMQRHGGTQQLDYFRDNLAHPELQAWAQGFETAYEAFQARARADSRS